MAASFNPVASTTNGISYGSNWASIFSIEFEPQVWQEWYKQFGKGFDLFDFLSIAGQSVSIKSDQITSFTDQAIEKPVQMNAEVATVVAAATCTFYLHDNEYLQGATAVTPHLRVGDTLFVDPQYTNMDVPTQWQVLTIGDTSSDASTMKAFDKLAAITTAIPIDSYLMVGPYVTGRKGGQPAARSTGTTSDTFYSTITAESGEIVGGINAKETYRQTRDKSGNAVLFNKMQVETEFQVNAGMDKQLFLGQVNDNSLTSVAKGSSTTATKGTKGLWHHVDDDGMELEYSTEFSTDHFDSIKDYLRTQGVTDTEVSFLAGSSLLKNIENNVLSFIREYSGGSDLMKSMNDVGANIRTFQKNGITNNLCELASFDNANTYGVMDDYFRNAGLIIPMSLATVKSDGINESAGNKVKIPNVSIGYLNNNNENRERMVGFESGMNGYGLPIVNEWDTVEYHIKSEYMMVANLVNQMIKIHKSGTYST